MAETLSTMLPLGTELPAFSLTDAVTGRKFTERDVAGPKATLVMFICNHCPFVKQMPELDRLVEEYGVKGIGVVAINSNDLETYPRGRSRGHDRPARQVLAFAARAASADV